MVAFISLPPEIINYILYDLAPPDLLACQLTNKYLDNTIRESVILQHKLALTRAFAEDSPLSHALTTEKLVALNSIENAWLEMRPDFSRRLQVPLRQSGVYDLTGGVYLLSSADRTSIGLLRLPSKEGDPLDWTMHLVGKVLVDVGLCVYEHDLMAIVTSTVRPGEVGSPNTFDIALEFVELSTRAPHPLAQKNPLFVMNSAWEKPSVGIEIVGKHLVLVLSFSARGHPQDRIFIFNWQTGVVIAGFEARSHTYAGLMFLDEDHILLPNTRSSNLDIYRIPPAPTLASLRPILVLELPKLNEGRILGFAPCRAEPNPIGKDSYPAMRSRQRPLSCDDYLDLEPQRGFLLKASTALCMFHLRVHILELNIMADGGLQMGFPFRYSFTFVTQRQGLLDVIQKHALKDTEPGSISEIPVLSYDTWGPDICAWFGSNENDISPQWITTSAGRRCVRMALPGPVDAEGERFFIFEFGEEVGEHPAKPEDGDDIPTRDGSGQHKGKGKANDNGEGEISGEDSLQPGPSSSGSRNVTLENAVLSIFAPRLPDTPPLEGPSNMAGDEEGDDVWPGGHPVESYTAWMQNQAFEQIDGADDEDDDDEDDQNDDDGMDYGSLQGSDSSDINNMFLDIHAGPEGGVPAVGDDGDLEPDDDNTDGGDNQHVHEDQHELAHLDDIPHYHFNHVADGDDESWAHDPLPDSEEDTRRVEGERHLYCPEVFRQPIRHRLPYTVRASRDRHRWDGILLDEERVIGIKASDHGHVDEIEIVHFG